VLVIRLLGSQGARSLISSRYHTVTRAINREFYGIESDTVNSLYVGSYGRGTAIDTSDIDILVELPESEYYRFCDAKGNGQSRLLQAVKSSILTPYPRSDIRADGQVVKIAFSDGMKFEILPAFRQSDYRGNTSYKYPDSNMGGNWRSTNPKVEQEAIRQKNSSSNGLLNDTCKHFRRVRDSHYSSYHLSGIVIDSFVYAAMGSWRWADTGKSVTSAHGMYEWVLLKYFETHTALLALSLLAPGSNQSISTENCLSCLEKVLRYIAE
jgi:predicted nucleotidyltransferase